MCLQAERLSSLILILYSMYDIKILRAHDIDVQKTLNQWKHKFTLRILSCVPCPHEKGVSHVTVCRTPKS